MKLARKFSKGVRKTVRSDRYKMIFPGIELERGSEAADEWDLGGEHRGGFKAVGTDSGTSGWGANLFIIDDPIDKKQAHSKVYRDSVWDWYQEVVENRLEPGAAIIIIMTRWDQDDLVGRLLKKEAQEVADGQEPEWRKINFVAMVEDENDKENDPLGREIGEVLWPERWAKEEVVKKKRRVGSRAWTSLQKGQPVDPKSQMFKREWFEANRYDELPPDCTRAAGIDTATSKKTSADNMSMVDVCRDRAGFLYVDDVFLDKVSVSTFAHYISNQHKIKKYKSLGIEENAAGEAVKQRVEEVGRDESTYPPIYGFVTSTDKVIRVMEFQALVENGTVKWKRGHKKVADLIDHLVDFDGTGGSIDDDVDGLGFGIKAVAAPVIDAEDFASVGTDRDTAGGDTRVEQDWDEM